MIDFGGMIREKIKEYGALLLFLMLVLLYLVKIFIVERGITAWDKPAKVAIIQLTESEEENHPEFFEIINNRKGYNYLQIEKYQSLYSIAGWYQKEYEKYTGRINTILDVDVLGPFLLNANPPTPPGTDGNIINRIFGTISFIDFFKDFARQKGINLDQYELTLYLYYYPLLKDRGDISHSVGSFRSRFGLVYAPIEKSEVNATLFEILHELAHIFGAEDKYSEDGRIKYPLGFAEPFKKPIYPQEKAELMAGEIPESENKSTAITTLNEVAIGPATAYEIGWISEERMRELYKLR